MGETSDFEDATKKKSDVYLAFVDAPVKESDELVIEDTFIGGQPIWLHPESKPSDDMLKCGACKSNENMKLLLQAFAPLDIEQNELLIKKLNTNGHLDNIDSNDDRVLYIFICEKCQRKSGSVKCIRGVKKNAKVNKINKIDEITGNNSMDQKKFDINPFNLNKNNANNNENANANVNPFSTTNTLTENPFSISAEDKTEKNKTKDQQEPSKKALRKLHDEKKDKEYDTTKTYKSYLLYVEEETFKNKPDHLKLPKNLKIDKEALDLTGNNEDDLEKDPIKLDPRTEKLSQFLDDDVFQKFQEIVGYNPLQVLRYDLGAKPLYYSATKVDLEKIIPKPGFNPSSQRVFEMQLMPKMILDLEENVSVVGGMEWGTILVFTDVENYIPQFDDNNVGYVEECVKVQWETSS